MVFCYNKNMDAKELDIVYFVKDTPRNEELRYSLRSVVKNMRYNRVWVFGGCPINVIPDVRVRTVQDGHTKWDNVRNMYLMACKNKEITDNFIMFNDDFFVMQPTDYIETLYRCDLDKHIEILESNFNNRPSSYTKLLRQASTKLKEIDEPCLSYELHIPFIFNKKKLFKMLEKFPDIHCCRTMYGNLYEVGGRQSGDVKIFSSKTKLDYKNLQFLSTDDSVVNVNNDIWRYIRNQFKQKCEYEI